MISQSLRLEAGKCRTAMDQSVEWRRGIKKERKRRRFKDEIQDDGQRCGEGQGAWY